MKDPRSVLSALVAASAFLVTACGGGGEDGSDGAASSVTPEYPTKNITLYVPYAPGGPTDLAARTVGDCLAKDFGQEVVVENREGASGSLGMQAMIQGGNDGYSLSLIAVPASATNPLQADVGYTNQDYVPIAVVTEIPSVLAVGQGSRFVDAKAFFAAAKENPGQVSVGVPGATTSQAMELQRLAEGYGIQFALVPFSGNAEMTTALLGGNVDAVFINASKDVLTNVDAGSFNPLAISPKERVDYLPDVPTLAELGYPELTNSVSVFGLAAPAGTPEDVLQTLEDGVRACLEQPDVVQTLGDQYVPDTFIGRGDFQARIDEIVSVYGPLLQQ